MAHIHTNPGEHDHTASAFIIRMDKQFDEPRIMLHKHKKLGVYLQFGGHIELNETPWQAIAHELTEESGYELSALKILQPKVRMKTLSNANMHPISVNHNTHFFDPKGEHRHSDVGYAFIATEAPSTSIADGESNEIDLLTREELGSLSTPNEIYENVREIALFCLDLAESGDWESIDTSEFSLLLQT